MDKLTKREEEYMHVLWKLDKAFIKDIIANLPDPKPHYNTVATILKILRDKGVVDHEKFGNTYRFYPKIEKEAYQKKALKDILSGYFDNSYTNLVTYFAKEEKISPAELESIAKLIKKAKN